MTSPVTCKLDIVGSNDKPALHCTQIYLFIMSCILTNITYKVLLFCTVIVCFNKKLKGGPKKTSPPKI